MRLTENSDKQSVKNTNMVFKKIFIIDLENLIRLTQTAIRIGLKMSILML